MTLESRMVERRAKTINVLTNTKQQGLLVRAYEKPLLTYDRYMH